MRRNMVGPAVVVLCLLAVAVSTGSTASAQNRDERDRTDRTDQTDQETEPGRGDPAEQAVRQIINGTPIDISERPWHVYVSNTFFGGSWCGGSLIAPNLVLTAAHCLDSLPPAEFVFVSAGSSTRGDIETGDYQYAATYTLHPSWVPGADFGPDQGLDLALVELPRPFSLSPNLQPVPLASQAETNAALGGLGLLSGWGVTSLPAADGDTSEILLSGTGQIISDPLCDALNPGRTINYANEICLDGLLTNQTGCFGDSGSAMVTEINGVLKQVGVASWTVLGCSQRFMGFAETAAANSWISANAVPVDNGAGFVTGRLWIDANENGIEEPGEAGLANTIVNLSMVHPYDAPETVFLTDITDGDGNYSFVTPFPGWYEVQTSPPATLTPADHDLGADDQIDNDFQWFSSAGLALAQPRLVRGGETIADVDGGFIPTAAVTGIIFQDNDLDGIRGPDDSLLADIEGNAWVDVIDEAGVFVASHALQNGPNFTLKVPAGTYRLEFYRSTFLRDVTYPNRGDSEANDSDFSPYTLKTERFDATVGNTYTFDLGLMPAGTASIQADVANSNCDGQVSIVDALVIAQFNVGIRQDVGLCPLTNPATQIAAGNGDLNLDGTTDIVDALLIARCDSGITGFYCE